ncbi:MAG: methyltransferase domain-containing protein [Phycisphaerales bacterium]|nr:methyltransferase domain-containing protein [Phycisphaerales bacterium]
MSAGPARAENPLAGATVEASSLGLGIRIVHEDHDVLVIDKPPGVVSAPAPRDEADSGPGPREDRSVFGLVKRYVRERRRRDARAWIIHRLDREASGLMIFAKTMKAFEWLKEDFRAKRVHRIYNAVVEGEIPPVAGKPASGTVQSFLEEDQYGVMRSVQDRLRRGPARRNVEPGDGPKLAVTHYRVIASGEGRSLIQLRLETGRKNQIRVHMKEMAHPIIGDERYGAATNPIGRMALHASELGFTHPKTGQTVRFMSPVPASFYKAVGLPAPASAAMADPAPWPAPSVEAAPKPAEAPKEPTGPVRLAARAGSIDKSVEPAPPPLSADEERRRAGELSRLPDTSWDHVAAWYDKLVGEGKSDHHENVIIPGTMRLVRPERGMRLLDVACGEGVLGRRLSELGVGIVGVDASARLVEAARRALRRGPHGAVDSRFEVGDARKIGEVAEELNLGTFDAATCVMALMNIEPLEPVLRGVASVLRPGGAFVAVILHPAFRAPGQTAWNWEKPGQRGKQFRRVDGYLSLGQTEITMNPGRAAHGGERVSTWTFHRPIQTYVKALAAAGFMIESIEEWPSLRQSQAGPHAREENRARKEIPMFLGWRAIKTGGAAPISGVREPPPGSAPV